mgnify:CR=1 FL=1
MSNKFNQQVLNTLVGLEGPSFAQVRQALVAGGESSSDYETDRYAREAYQRNLRSGKFSFMFGCPGSGKSY